MANEDKKILMQCYTIARICLKFRPLLIRKALRNMAETECTMPHRLTMTR